LLLEQEHVEQLVLHEEDDELEVEHEQAILVLFL